MPLPARSVPLSPPPETAARPATTGRAAVPWREYAMEGAELAAFMVAACVVVALLEHPASAASHLVPSSTVRRALTGVAMGLTAIAIVYSPWGKRSGAHFNPAVTLAYWRLGRITGRDAAGYVAAQVTGAVAGVALAALVLGDTIAHPRVRWVATVPGPWGALAAALAEATLAYVLMRSVLVASSMRGVERWTGVVAGTLVALFIAVEAPVSGMSINPARTLGPAIVGGVWESVWLYLLAPVVGTWLAARHHEDRPDDVGCAKLRHDHAVPCIFCARRREQRA